MSRQSAWRRFHAGVAPVPAHQLATGTILVEEPPAVRAGVALYARVSSGDQRADLDRPWWPGSQCKRQRMDWLRRRSWPRSAPDWAASA